MKSHVYILKQGILPYSSWLERFIPQIVLYVINVLELELCHQKIRYKGNKYVK